MLSTPNDNSFKATSTFVTPPLRIKESMIIVVRLLITLLYVTHSKEMKIGDQFQSRTINTCIEIQD